jgi:hypothetical protein
MKELNVVSSWNGVRLSPLCTSATDGPIVPAPDDGWVWSSRWNGWGWEEPKYSEETCHSATLSTTNPTWRDPGSNQVRRRGKPATNRLIYDTPVECCYIAESGIDWKFEEKRLLPLEPLLSEFWHRSAAGVWSDESVRMIWTLADAGRPSVCFKIFMPQCSYSTTSQGDREVSHRLLSGSERVDLSC